MLYSEYDACAEFNLAPDVYFSKPRDERALMVVTVVARRAIDAMRSYDQNPPKKGKKR
jgi:hypothetical protein